MRIQRNVDFIIEFMSRVFFFFLNYLFYNSKSNFINFTYSFNNTLYILFSIFPYNQSYQD